MEIIMLIFFVFVVIVLATNTSKTADHNKRNYCDSHDDNFETTNFFNSQHTESYQHFDSYTDHCTSDNCCDQGCSDSNCDCGSSDGGGCD